MPQPSQQSADRAERIDRIAALNDSLRRSICSPGRNQIVMTAGVAALVGDVSLFRGFRRRAEILRTVRNYDSFNSDRKSVVSGKRVSVRVDIGGGGIIKKKNKKK